MTETEMLTLRDVFEQAGLTETQIHDILLLLRFKPRKVQLAFYYVSTGHTQKEAGEKIGVTQQQANKYIRDNCEDIKDYLKNKENNN